MEVVMTERKDLFAGLVKRVVELGLYTQEQIDDMEWLDSRPIQLVELLKTKHPDALIGILSAVALSKAEVELPAGKKTMAELLISNGLVTLFQLDEIRNESDATGGRFLTVAAEMGYVTEKQVVELLSRQYGVPSVMLDKITILDEVMRLVPQEVCEQHCIVPVEKQGETLILAVTDPSNIYALDDVKFLTGYNVEMVVATERAIWEKLEQYWGKSDEEEVVTPFEVPCAPTGVSEDGRVVERAVEQGAKPFVVAMEDGTERNVEECLKKTMEEVVSLEKAAQQAEEVPVVRLVNLILVDAIRRGASEIQIMATGEQFVVRYRVDGVLYDIMKPPLRLRQVVLTRIKIMADLDIEKKEAQSGMFELILGSCERRCFTVVTVPMPGGEKIFLVRQCK